ncbi:MAG: hypothetical protein KDM81_04765 [Verrucomicrobiae bacterium]|nr:hypothetical protein [Verrucomicrobiae bacterium]MCP5520141.1 hypothetical protein [Verrucomicrobiales bacterium]
MTASLPDPVLAFLLPGGMELTFILATGAGLLALALVVVYSVVKSKPESTDDRSPHSNAGTTNAHPSGKS